MVEGQRWAKEDACKWCTDDDEAFLYYKPTSDGALRLYDVDILHIHCSKYLKEDTIFSHRLWSTRQIQSQFIFDRHLLRISVFVTHF